MMNLYSNSKGQRNPKLNKYQQVANRVRGADITIVKKLANAEAASRFTMVTTAMATKTSSSP